MRHKHAMGSSTRGVSPSTLARIVLNLGLLFVVVVVGLSLYLASHPIRLGAARADEQRASAMRSGGDGDVLLLLPPVNPEVDSASLEDLDFSANWANILAQEFGVFKLAQAGELTPQLLEGCFLAVVPVRTGQVMNAGQVATLEQYVRAGGRVLLEMPSGVWDTLVSVTSDPAQYRPSRRLTAFDGAVVRGDLRDDVLQAPLRTILAPITAGADIRQDHEVILEADGLPAYLRQTLGEGELYVLYFDAARAVASIQQGLPSSDWEIARPSVSLPAGFTRTASLLVDARIRRSLVPYADLLERNLLNVITARRPAGRIWLFPSGATGALVMTHSAIPTLEQGRYLIEWEQNNGFPSTVFVSLNPSDPPLEGNIATGVLLIPPEVPFAPANPIGIWRFKPLEATVSLEDQVLSLRSREAEPLMSRMNEGLWHPEYGRTFRNLAALGVDVDSSYGPAFHPTDLEAADGYGFGTGLPFQPVDRNGLLVDLVEIPYVLHDGAQLDRDFVEQVLAEAGRRYNQLVVAEWRTGTMFNEPQAEVVSLWRSILAQARDQGLWVTDLASFARFWQQRSQVQLHSSFSADQQRLSIWVNSAGVADSTGQIMRPSLAFEARYDGRPLERMTRNEEDVPFVQLERSGDGVFYIYDLPEGSSRIEISYQGPVEVLP